MSWTQFPEARITFIPAIYWCICCALLPVPARSLARDIVRSRETGRLSFGHACKLKVEGIISKRKALGTAQSNLDCSVLQKLLGKTIILGTLDLSDMTIETPETVAARIRRALPHVPAERIVVAPDCGLKYLPRDVAFAKMCAMVEGAKLVR